MLDWIRVLTVLVGCMVNAISFIGGFLIFVTIIVAVVLLLGGVTP